MSRLPAIRVFIVSSLLLATYVETSTAQPNLPFLNRKKSRQTASDDLTIKDGPWLIMCSSFSGENAEQDAMRLAAELKKFRLRTYLYRHSFDYSGSFTGLGWQQPDEDGNFARKPLVMKAANLEVVKETAVLVGDFPAIDDGRAQKTLSQLKQLTLGDLPGLVNPESNRQSKPFKAAILLPNPLLPEDFFRQPKVDSFILKINKKLEFSLLKCPGMYSVKIASFRGESKIDQGGKIRTARPTLKGIQFDRKKETSESRLLDAEAKAHDLTKILRRKGIEAYEFHDRTESYVCIGSFDWVTRETNDRVMNNPDIVKIVNACKPSVRNLPGAPNSILPKSVKGIPFDPEPTPIIVPRADRHARTAGRPGFLKR